MTEVVRLRDGQELPSELVNYDAEKAFLGACLANNEVWHKLADRLKPDHFADALHARVYESISKTVARGFRADVITLKKQFDQDGALSDIGGARYLVELASSVVTVINADDYGEQIIDLWRRRQVRKAAETAIAEASKFGPERTAGAVIETMEAQLAEIAAASSDARPAIHAGQAMLTAINRAEAAYKNSGPIGVSSGLKDLDRVTSGFHRSDLIILGGRPSMGKTALATSIGYGAARLGMVTDFFSQEMGAEQIGQRLVAMETGITVEQQRGGMITGNDFPNMMEAAQRVSDLPFIIEDEPGLTVAGIHSRARRRQRAQGLDLVIVDYLQLIKPAASKRRDSKYADVSDISADLKLMARKLDVPVLALCQLSRSVEMRDDKRPGLSDLRDSGAIEQDADVVLFVYREQYYLERAEPKQAAGESDEKFQKRRDGWDRQMNAARNVAEVIVAKNRHGPTRTARLRFDGPRQLFQDLQQDLI
jgi:replicative DNA helicase